MKKLIAFLAITAALATNAASACPDLRGTYQVSNEPGAFTISISQKNEGGITTYALKNVSFGFPAEIMIADGKAHSLENTIHGRGHQNAQSIVQCSNDVVTYRYDGDLVHGSENVRHVTELRTYKLDEKKNLITTMVLLVNGFVNPIPGTTATESTTTFYRVK